MVFVCTNCGKEYKQKHAALCHMPKCPGQARQLETGYVYAVCSNAFQTKIGLSQHERHAHPAVRNVVRAGGLNGTEPRTRQGKVFTMQEEEKMFELEIVLRHESNISSKMREHLPGKTTKQIRDKRLTKTYKRRREEILAPYMLPGINEVVAEGEANHEGTGDDVPEGSDVVAHGDPPHQEPEEAHAEREEETRINEMALALQEAVWREEVARVVLATEFSASISAEAAAGIRLLRGILAEIVSKQGVLPSKVAMLDMDENIAQYFKKEATAKEIARGKRGRIEASKSLSMPKLKSCIGKMQAFWPNTQGRISTGPNKGSTN